jgi:hypothetical protein
MVPDPVAALRQVRWDVTYQRLFTAGLIDREIDVREAFFTPREQTTSRIGPR